MYFINRKLTREFTLMLQMSVKMKKPIKRGFGLFKRRTQFLSLKPVSQYF